MPHVELPQAEFKVRALCVFSGSAEEDVLSLWSVARVLS
jgi:hypothetical protein